MLLQSSPYSTYGTSRSYSGHKDVHLSIGISPDLLSGSTYMNRRVSRIFELLQNNRSGSSRLQFLSLGNGSFHPVCSRSKYKLRSQRLQQVPAFHTHRVGHGQYQLIAFGSSHKCQTDSGISTGWLYNNRSWPQRPLHFGIFNHGQRNTVFHTSGRIEIFQLCYYTCFEPFTCVIITQLQ